MAKKQYKKWKNVTNKIIWTQIKKRHGIHCQKEAMDNFCYQGKNKLMLMSTILREQIQDGAKKINQISIIWNFHNV